MKPERAKPDLSTVIAGVRLPNPVMAASGTWEYENIHDAVIRPEELGAIVNKTVLIDKRPGNPPPRLCETPSGMLNSIGLPGEGIEDFIKNKLPLYRGFGPPVIVSLAGTTYDEWLDLTEKIEATGMADLIELDLSCPNVADGIAWANDERILARVVSMVARRTRLPIIAKLSPSVTDIAQMARIAEDFGASAVAMINTFKAMAIDVRTKRPVLGNLTGGLSGPAVHPVAVWSVYSSYQAVKIPIIGMGGVHDWRSAVELLLAGASAVAVGMYNFVNPRAMKDVIEGIAKYLEEEGIASVRELIGKAHG